MTLVFIHGAACLPRVFDAQRDAFPDALYPALPGHGTSGEPATIDAFADSIGALLDARGIERAILAGSSMGGAAALTLALRKHPRVAALALLGSAARLRVAPAFLEGLATDFEATCRTIAGFFYASNDPALVEASVRQMLEVGQAQVERDFRACDAFDVTERLGEIVIPVLALTGEADRMTPPKAALALADRIPGAEARIVPQAGHLLFLERPGDTNDLLRAFVITIESSVA